MISGTVSLIYYFIAGVIVGIAAIVRNISGKLGYAKLLYSFHQEN
jgi:hypothetical protein